MTDARQDHAVRVSRASTESMRRFGLMVAIIGTVALVVAFIPGATAIALTLGLLGIGLGILCLALDRLFNIPGLAGTVVSSAAVSVSIIMALIYAA